MVKSQKKVVASSSRASLPGQVKGPVEWTPKMTMNMSDLSRDDDFLNHLLVEKLGTGGIPLYVHKMDPSRTLPKTDPNDLMAIVQRLIVAKGHPVRVIKQAVDELLRLHAVRTFIKNFPQAQIDAFATHASRYFELYLPTGSIEIAHTSRYTHRTGKSELCILATRYLATGTVVTELKGSMAKLSREDEKQMKRNTDIRRDFSVIHSGQMKRNHLFLGPARFVNHDCENNCELFREGKYITFRTLRPIAIGEEITAHYGDGYFGRRNRHCLCATCERKGRGGYALQQPGTDDLPGSESDSSSDSDTSNELEDEPHVNEQVQQNVNERRTRRGIYHIAQGGSDDSDNSDAEDRGNGKGVDEQVAKPEVVNPVVKLEEKDASSELSSLPPSRRSSDASAGPSRAGPSRGVGMMTPDTDTTAPSPAQIPQVFAATPILDDDLSRTGTPATSYKSIIATRRQKAAAAVTTEMVKRQLVTPPPSIETSSLPDDSSVSTATVSKRLTRADKGKGKATAIDVDADDEVMEVTRVLRTRPSTIIIPVGTPVKQETPRDENGKILPTCLTCHSILPIIHVDKEVVWGVGKKKEMQECPRCMRHFAIYSHPWPARTAGQRARYMPTPREELTPVDSSAHRVSAKVLPTLDWKLAAAAKNPTKSRLRDRDAPQDEPPAKKRKTEPGAKASTSNKAKQALSGNHTRSGRESRLSTKAQDKDVIVKRPVGRPRKHPLPPPPPPPRSPTLSPAIHEGTPLASHDPIAQTVSAPVESRTTGQNRNMRPYARPTKATVVLYQPRDGQGRFGKKASTNGKYMRKKLAKNNSKLRTRRASEGTTIKIEDEDFAELAGENEVAEDEDDEPEGEGKLGAPLRNINGRERKRRKDLNAESPHKRLRLTFDQESDSISISLRSLPMAAPEFAAKRVMSSHRPNPMNLSRPHWISQTRRGLRTKRDILHFDDADPLELPSNRIQRLSRNSHRAYHQSAEQEEPQQVAPAQIEAPESQAWRTIFPEEAVVPLGGALTLRPSPSTYAKRRWSSDKWNLQGSSSNESDEPEDQDNADDDESVDIDIDFQKRYSVYYTTAALNDFSSDEEDNWLTEDTEKYMLSRKASFFEESARANTSDSERVVEGLVSASMDYSSA